MTYVKYHDPDWFRYSPRGSGPRPAESYRGAIRNKQFGRRPQGQGNTTPRERAVIRGEVAEDASD